MAWAAVAQATSRNTDHNTAAPSLNSTGATFGILVVGYQASNAFSSIVDSYGNTWTLAKALSAGANQVATAIYYSNFTTVGSGHSVTVTATGDFPNCTFAVFSGGAGTPDQSNSQLGVTTSSQQTGSITPGQNNELLIASIAGTISSNTVSSIDSSFTQYSTSNADALNFACALAYQVQTTATTRNPTWTLTQNGNNAAAIVSFKTSPAQLAADSTATFSSTTGLTAINRFVCDSTISVNTTSTLKARSAFATASTLSFSTSSDFSARSSTVPTVLLNGVDISRYTSHREATITLGCNGTADTASVRVHGGTNGVSAPTVGQQLTIALGFTTIFDGEVIDVGLEQDTAVDVPFWRLNATDFSFLLKAKLITQSWTSTNADVIASAIVTSVTGFTTTNVESGLPAVSFSCAFEDALSALTRLAQMINASWKFISKDLYFRSTPTLTNPATLNSSNKTFQKLRYNRSITQAATQAIVQGGGTLGGTATVVSTGLAASGSTLPLTQSLGFSPSGYAIVQLPISGTYPVIEETLLLAYSGVQNGSPVSAPTLPPTLSAMSSSPSGNVPQGQLYYAQTFRTSAGSTGTGPTLSLFTSSFPPSFPATGSVTLTLQAPTDPTVQYVDVYRSWVNGNSSFLFLAGTVTKPSNPPIWPNPLQFIDTAADSALGGAALAPGAVAPQGNTPPLATIAAFPALTGVTNALGGSVPAIPPGSAVAVASVVTDATKQSTLAGYEGNDGIRQAFYQRADSAVTVALANEVGTSLLATIPVPLESANFLSQDAHCVPLASAVISLNGISTTLVIQSVTITWPTKTLMQRSVKAANQYQTIYQWLRDVNKLVISPKAA